MKVLGIIIRGKHSEAHDPDLLAQHADVILSDGSPVGYFGQGGGSFGNIGMFMDGVVFDYNSYLNYRPEYVDIDTARQANVISTVCTVRVDDAVAKRFDDYWKRLDKSARAGKESFSLLGNNCSTHASDAFRFAGVLKEGIPGLDTPQNLYHQLKIKYGGNFRCTSGYIGFTGTGAHFNLQVEKP